MSTFMSERTNNVKKNSLNNVYKIKKNQSLERFLKEWDEEYKDQALGIDLFNKSLVAKWNEKQKQHFIKIFYHSRGHFKDFLWHLGNYAPNKIFKDIILKNVEEEFNGDYQSHEELYLDFAAQNKVDLSMEYIANQYHSPKMRQFNQLHLDWLYLHKNWTSKFSAFSAYERLDSTDYEFLSNVFFEDLKDEHIFFKIHRKAKHFDNTYMNLAELWEIDRSLIEEAFTFIADTQLDMWRDLSNETFSFS